MFNSKIKREKKELNEALKKIEILFVNLAEGREFEVFNKKYFEILKNKIKDDVLKDLKKSLFYCYVLSNNLNKSSNGFIISNKGKNDSIINKFITADEISFYMLLGNAQ